MPESINWLHITDLHFGLDSHGWLWPRTKHELFRDLEQLAGEIGGWDIVFFTGELTQRGEKGEFESLSRELKELWAILAKSGSSPVLAVVPGNHDLVRPPSDSLILKSITQLWWTDLEMRKKFWTDKASESRRAIEQYFSNYSAWV